MIWTLITSFIGDNWQWVAGALGGLLALFTARQSGKKAERLKSTQKDMRNARNIEDRADAARAGRDKRPADERLRELDGLRDE